jgi:hypothetical protein
MASLIPLQAFIRDNTDRDRSIMQSIIPTNDRGLLGSSREGIGLFSCDDLPPENFIPVTVQIRDADHPKTEVRACNSPPLHTTSNHSLQ